MTDDLSKLEAKIACIIHEHVLVANFQKQDVVCPCRAMAKEIIRELAKEVAFKALFPEPDPPLFSSVAQQFPNGGGGHGWPRSPGGVIAYGGGGAGGAGSISNINPQVPPKKVDIALIDKIVEEFFNSRKP